MAVRARIITPLRHGHALEEGDRGGAATVGDVVVIGFSKGCVLNQVSCRSSQHSSCYRDTSFFSFFLVLGDMNLRVLMLRAMLRDFLLGGCHFCLWRVARVVRNNMKKTRNVRSWWANNARGLDS